MPHQRKFFDKGGNEISMYQWTALRKNIDYCEITKKFTDHGTIIKTEWLGSSVSPNLDFQRFVFETLVYRDILNREIEMIEQVYSNSLTEALTINSLLHVKYDNLENNVNVVYLLEYKKRKKA